MVPWEEFAEAEPALASYGKQLIQAFGTAYLATVRRDGSPRIHPVSPVFAEGCLYLGVIPATPKFRDLSEDGRLVLHSLPGPHSGEFFVRGVAQLANDPKSQRAYEIAAEGSIITSSNDVLFELLIEQAFSKSYEWHDSYGLMGNSRSWSAESKTGA